MSVHPLTREKWHFSQLYLRPVKFHPLIVCSKSLQFFKIKYFESPTRGQSKTPNLFSSESHCYLQQLYKSSDAKIIISIWIAGMKLIWSDAAAANLHRHSLAYEIRDFHANELWYYGIMVFSDTVPCSLVGIKQTIRNHARWQDYKHYDTHTFFHPNYTFLSQKKYSSTKNKPWRPRWRVEVQLYSIFNINVRKRSAVKDTPRPHYPQETSSIGTWKFNAVQEFT
jgi:hypothetical protein